MTIRRLLSTALMLVSLPLATALAANDRFDAAVATSARPQKDLKRDALDHPADILRLTDIKPGMTVADLLAGDGYYSELASYVVGPSGKVLLINNAAFDKWSEPDLDARLAGDRLPNVVRQTVNLDDMKLAPASLDALFLVKVYHDLYWVDSQGVWPKVNVGAVLDQIARALKPGGRLLLVDHSAVKGHGSSDATSLHRIEETFAIKDFKAHGFVVQETSDLLRQPKDARDQISYKGPMLGKTDRFVVVFRKP